MNKVKVEEVKYLVNMNAKKGIVSAVKRLALFFMSKIPSVWEFTSNEKRGLRNSEPLNHWIRT